MRTVLFISLILISIAAQGQVATRVLKDSLFIPWELVYGPDDHIWFTQKNGYICRLDPENGATDTLLHETEVVVRGEGGMLGMALHPEFSSNPYVYVFYNYTEGSVYRGRLVRYTYSGNALADRLVLIDEVPASTNHNGSRLLFEGGLLYITTGDAEQPSSAQHIDLLSGKVLRIAPDGGIPDDNPVPGSPVWAWGFRNSQGLISVGGKLFASEHGPNSDDELNRLLKGRNFGWPSVNGFCDDPAEAQFCADSAVAEPLYAWSPTLAVSGMTYYDGTMFPELRGAILMGTLKNSRLYQIRLDEDLESVESVREVEGIAFGRIRALCTAPDGRIFLSTSNSPAHGNGDRTDRIIELRNASSGIASAGTEGAGAALQLFPNPVRNNHLSLTAVPGGSAQSSWKISVTGVTGKLWHSSVLSMPARVSLDAIPAGVYLLRYSDGQNVHGAIPFVKAD